MLLYMLAEVQTVGSGIEKILCGIRTVAVPMDVIGRLRPLSHLLPISILIREVSFSLY